MQRPKRVAAIHDLSVFGRCSLSVITPVISAMGVQVLPIPTVLMSTHTGGFSDIEFDNCDNFVSRTAHHLNKCNAEIDCIYSGYIADKTAFDGVYDFFKSFPSAKRIIDPVLGDHGRLYSALSEEIVGYMRYLIGSADIITPNLTEVFLLLNEPYREVISKNDIPNIIEKLKILTKADIVITGVTDEHNNKYNICYQNGEISLIPCFYIHSSYEGTGDTFASVIAGSVIKGEDLKTGIITASQFVEKCIDLTFDSGEPKRDGIFIESALPLLYKKIVPDRKIIKL